MKQQPRKYPLKTGHNKVELEGGFFGCHLGFKGQQLNMWVTAKIGAPVEAMHLYVAMTGETLPDHPNEGRNDWGYLGTAVTADGSFVQHIYY